jgi:hypothetical protein
MGLFANFLGDGGTLGGLMGTGVQPPVGTPVPSVGDVGIAANPPPAAPTVQVAQNGGLMPISDAAQKYNFAGLESQHNIPPGYLSSILNVESGDKRGNFNPNAHNDSGAAGPFQYVPSTARRMGLSNPYDVGASAEATARMAGNDYAHLSNALGRPATIPELYMTHQQGSGIIPALAHPNEPAANYVKASALTSNGMPANVKGGEMVNYFAKALNAGGPTVNTAMSAANTGAGATMPAAVAGETPGGLMGYNNVGMNTTQQVAMPPGTNNAPIVPVPGGPLPAAVPTTVAAGTGASWSQKAKELAGILKQGQEGMAKQEQKPAAAPQGGYNAYLAQHNQMVEALARQLAQKTFRS